MEKKNFQLLPFNESDNCNDKVSNNFYFRNAMTSQEVVDFVREKINKPPYQECPSIICEQVCVCIMHDVNFSWMKELELIIDLSGSLSFLKKKILIIFKFSLIFIL